MRIFKSLMIALAVVSISYAQENNLDKSVFINLATCEPTADEIAKARSGSRNSRAALGAIQDGNLFWRWGKLKRSSENYQRAVDLDPTLYSAQFNLGVTQLQTREFRNAALAFREALRLRPESVTAWQHLAFTYYHGKQFDKAAEAFARANQLAPADAITSNNLGFAYIFSGRYPDAIGSFEIALRHNPNFREALNGLCSAQALLEKASAAFDACLNAATHDPDSPVAHYFLGYGYLDRGEHQNGLSAFQKADRIEPHSAKIQVGLGFAYLKLRQYPQALQQFQLARTIDNNVQHALLGIGATYVQMKDYAKAENALREAIVFEPNNTAARFKLGVVCLARRNRDCALSEYNRLKMADDELAKRLFNKLFQDRVLDVSTLNK